MKVCWKKTCPYWNERQNSCCLHLAMAPHGIFSSQATVQVNLLFTGLCIRREQSNLKTLATTRKILRSAVYLCILPSLIQMFYNSHKKILFGIFWLACSPICTCFSCFIVLKHITLKYPNHSPSEQGFVFLLLHVKTYIN